MNLPVYLVSLESDTTRRKELKKRFTKHYSSFLHIPAVDGRTMKAKEYYQKTLPYYLKYNKTMSPAEWGCTSSHTNALEAFLESDESYALILEDDVIGNDQDIEKIFKLTKNLDTNSLLLCGGQEGLNQKYQLGKKISNKEVYEVHPFSYRFMLRTCCYIVTRQSAKEILDYHANCLTLADKWDEFFKNTSTKIYYVNILKHPEDLINSHIEAERETQDKTFKQKLFSIDAPRKVYNKIYYHFMALALKVLGFKKL